MTITAKNFGAFRCLITREIMENPVMIADCGHSFEESAIIDRTKQNLSCPACQIETTQLLPNSTLKRALHTIPPFTTIRIAQIQNTIDERLKRLQNRVNQLDLPVEDTELSIAEKETILTSEAKNIRLATVLTINGESTPVVLINCFHQFEKIFIEARLEEDSLCPECGVGAPPESVIPNRSLQAAMQEFSDITVRKVLKSRRCEILKCATLQKQIQERPKSMIERTCDWIGMKIAYMFVGNRPFR